MTTTETARTEPKTSRESWESKLGEGRQRFLAHVIEHGLMHGRRTPDDFIRHFPPSAIMNGLRDQPQLRTNILVVATGVKAKVALKKNAESCGNDLQIALEEGETNAETVVSLFEPDDRVRYLEDRALWAYIVEGSFWQVEAGKDRARHAVAATHIAFMIDRALRDRLLTHKDVVDRITVAKIAELLPRGELEKIISASLTAGNANKPYVESNLLAATPMTTLVQHIPLPWIWEQLIAPRIAETHGFVAKPAAKVAPPPKAEPSKDALKDAKIVDGAPTATLPVMAEEHTSTQGIPIEGLDLDVDDVLDGAPSKPAPAPKPGRKG